MKHQNGIKDNVVLPVRMEAVFSCAGLRFGYAEDSPLLDHIDFALFPGQSIGLAGANGCGKTTFLRCLAGLEKIWSGEICLEGKALQTEKDFTRFRRNVGFAVQNAEDQLFFSTCLEDVMFGPLNLGLSQAEAEERGRHWLARTGLAGKEDKLVPHLSGGQQKLLALAGIFAMQPRALLLDEPFNGLDENSIERICLLLEESPASKLIVCHDLKLLEKLCGKVIWLANGKLLENRPLSGVPAANGACAGPDAPEHLWQGRENGADH